MFLVS